jgi:hypothetical protein
VLNFSLVITLALAPPPQWPSVLIREASPLLAIFYLAAIAERALSYWRLPPINSVQTERRDNAATVPSASLGASLTGLDGSDSPRSRAQRRAVCCCRRSSELNAVWSWSSCPRELPRHSKRFMRAVAVAWELGTRRLNAVAQNLFRRRPAAAAVIVSRTRQLHDSASPRDGDGFGPLTIE